MNIVYRCGVDKENRPIVVIVPANLPAKSVDMELVMLFAISILDPIVEKDYVLVYVRTGMASSNRPSFAFLKQAYRIFNRKYKKNLKQLFIVHPSFWVKTSFRLFRPFLSRKFWKKLTYIDNVSQFDEYINKDQLTLPRIALLKSASTSQQSVMGVDIEQVFSRPELNANDPNLSPDELSGYNLPTFLEQCIAYLKKNAHLEGLLRLSGSMSQIQLLTSAVDKGQLEIFDTLTDAHVVAGFLKLWMRELPTPLIDQYYPFVDAAQSAMKIEHKEGDPSPTSKAVLPILKQLSDVKKRCLLALLELCGVIYDKKEVNLMNARNIGIVMAPNLLNCPDNDMSIILKNTPILNEAVRWLILDHQFIVDELKTTISK